MHAGLGPVILVFDGNANVFIQVQTVPNRVYASDLRSKICTSLHPHAHTTLLCFAWLIDRTIDVQVKPVLMNANAKAKEIRFLTQSNSSISLQN